MSSSGLRLEYFGMEVFGNGGSTISLGAAAGLEVARLDRSPLAARGLLDMRQRVGADQTTSVGLAFKRNADSAYGRQKIRLLTWQAAGIHHAPPERFGEHGKLFRRQQNVRVHIMRSRPWVAVDQALGEIGAGLWAGRPLVAVNVRNDGAA